MSIEEKPAFVDGEVEFVKGEHIEVQPSYDKKTERETVLRMDLLLVPVTCIIYLLSFLDRANLGNARVAGLQEQLNLSDYQYQIVLTVTYIPYIAAEIPSNLVLKKFGPRLMLPGMCFCWGVVTTLQSQVHSFGGLVTCRFFLGLFEGGLLPGIILYLSGFYRRQELQLRVCLFFCAAALAGAFSGLLAAAIVGMDGVGGMEGWRWHATLYASSCMAFTNLAPGIFTVAWGAMSFFLLPNTAQGVLSFKAQHIQCCEERLLLDIKSRVPEITKFDLKKAFSAFTSLHVWLITLAQFAGGTTFFGLAYFTPSIVKSLAESFDTKLSLAQIQLLTVPPYAVGFLAAIATAWVSDRYQRRGITGLAMILLAILGWVLFYVAPIENVGQRYTALIIIVTGVYATAPSLTAWIPNNVACHMKRATAIAMSFIATSMGGIVSSWIYPRSSGPQYKFAARFNLALACFAAVFIVAEMLLLRHLNKMKLEKREKLLRDVADLDEHEQFERLGDRHPDFKYTL